MEQILVEYPRGWRDYELIDSGDYEKLERFGSYTVVRPDPRILWKKTQQASVWQHADAKFSGRWDMRNSPPDPWKITYGDSVFTLRPTDFKHVGIFPEQAVNWDWLSAVINKRPLKVLNLFAYTGGATIAAGKEGAHVTHVDSQKGALAWASQNVELSGLSKQSVRWICDDAYAFVLREGKRGVKYDGIIMDPPRFGRGSKGQVWKLEEDLPKLVAGCKEILSTRAAFMLVNAYTADVSSLVLKNLLEDFFEKKSGTVEWSELTLKESSTPRLIPSGIVARWSSL